MLNTPLDIQTNEKGELKHFLTVKGLNQALIESILDKAQHFVDLHKNGVKKFKSLQGKTVANLFFEPSTRTRTTFELAAKRLSADVMNININTSATTKGESLLDTLQNLEAMHVDMFVVRHEFSGASHFIAEHVQPHISVINGGDGLHAHPSQALLDMLTIRQHKKHFEPLTVAIIGDILHSRVARSQILALNTLGTGEIRVIAPKTLLPKQVESFGVRVFHELEAGLEGADVVIMLRLQKERMQDAHLPSQHEYFNQFGLTRRKLKLAKPDAIVMHPGPINRGIEISSGVADSDQAVILEQVSNGIAIRMAVMSMVMNAEDIPLEAL